MILFQRGISLIEVLISTLVVSTLVALGLPAFANLGHDNHRDTLMQSLSRSILVAREAALGESSAIGICPSSDGTLCTTSATDWQRGWLLYVDHNANGSLDQNEPVLQVQAALEKSPKLQVRSSATQLSYQSDGSLASPFQYLICDGRGIDESRMMQIGRVGRATISRAPADCG